MGFAMQHISSAELLAFEERYRARLVNSLSGFKSANLIGTVSTTDDFNLAIFSSVVHLGSSPALLGMVTRPVTVTRDTYKNIVDTGVYTVNHINSDIWQAAHQTSARYPAEVSEFEQTGLTPQLLSCSKAPFVKEANIKCAMRLLDVLPIKANDTKLIIGQIEDIFITKNVLNEDGYVDIQRAKSVAISALDSYHTTHALGRLAYAKPDQPTRLLNQLGDNAIE